MMFKKGKDDTCSDPTAWNFTADTTNGDKPLDAELNFDVYHVSKTRQTFFKDIHTRIWKLWDAKHVTNEDTHFTDNLSIVCKHWTHTHACIYHYQTLNKIGLKSGMFFIYVTVASTVRFFWWICSRNEKIKNCRFWNKNSQYM